MNELWRALVLGFGLWWLGILLPIPCDPFLLVVMVLGIVGRNEWIGLIAAMLFGLFAEAVWFVPSGVLFSTYILGYAVVTYFEQRFHVMTFVPRLLVTLTGALTAVYLLHILYEPRDQTWPTLFDFMTMTSIITTSVAASLIAPLFAMWSEPRHRRGQSLFELM